MTSWTELKDDEDSLSTYEVVETADVAEDVVVNYDKRLSALIFQYKTENVYNKDESGLLHLLQSDKAVSSGSVKGCKKI